MQLSISKGIKNIPDLSVFLGYDSPEKLYRLKRKPDAKPSYDMLEDLTNKFENLNLSWLVTGTGEMELVDKKYDDTPSVTTRWEEQNHEYITTTPQSNPETKTTITPKLDPFLTRSESDMRYLTPQIISTDSTGKENILHVSAKAAAGYLTGHGDRKFAQTLPSFSLPGLTNYSYRSFEVEGDSMYPTLENKEMVIGQWVEGLEYIREDRVHIVVTKNDGIVIKRLLNRVDKYGYVIAKSDALDNRNLYPNLDIRPDDILEIWYAVWHGSFNFKSPGEVYKRMNNLEADLFEVMRRLKEQGILTK